MWDILALRLHDLLAVFGGSSLALSLPLGALLCGNLRALLCIDLLAVWDSLDRAAWFFHLSAVGFDERRPTLFPWFFSAFRLEHILAFILLDGFAFKLSRLLANLLFHILACFLGTRGAGCLGDLLARSFGNFPAFRFRHIFAIFNGFGGASRFAVWVLDTCLRGAAHDGARGSFVAHIRLPLCALCALRTRPAATFHCKNVASTLSERQQHREKAAYCSCLDHCALLERRGPLGEGRGAEGFDSHDLTHAKTTAVQNLASLTN